MIDINTLTDTEFKALPLVIEGESKEVRYAGEGLVVIRFKPTVYSYTANRCGEIEGSDVLRMRASKIFTEVLKKAGIHHAYQQVNDRFVLAHLILPTGPHSFVPEDLTDQTVGVWHKAPPIEVVIKRMHSGTSKHRYYDMTKYGVRKDHPYYPNRAFQNEDAYPSAIVRFDWRNPLFDQVGNRLQDEILPDSMADWYINVQEARKTALLTYKALSDFLEARDIMIYDLCLFITQSGAEVFGEISQDCGRFRHLSLGSLDKDIWRTGGSSSQVIEKWQLLLDLIQ